MSEEEQAWADAILADPSDAQLLVWADWLEENGDEACEGVRWLVENGKRPWDADEFFGWTRHLTDDGEAIPRSVFANLCLANDPFYCSRYPSNKLHCYEVRGTWTRAVAQYTALLDAARAAVKYLHEQALSVQ